MRILPVEDDHALPKAVLALRGRALQINQSHKARRQAVSAVKIVTPWS
jgi:hypothetical protein